MPSVVIYGLSDDLVELDSDDGVPVPDGGEIDCYDEDVVLELVSGDQQLNVYCAFGFEGVWHFTPMLPVEGEDISNFTITQGKQSDRSMYIKVSAPELKVLKLMQVPHSD